MSIATVVTLGFGQFGSVNRLPTLGYDTLSQDISFCIEATDSFAPGAMKSSSFLPGTKAFDEHTPGPTKAGGC